MTIKQDFEKMEERVEGCEIKHDEKVIAREQQDIVNEQAKIVKHSNDADASALEGKTGFFHDMDEKIKAEEVKHDEKVIEHKTDKIEREQEKIKEHEAKIAAEEAKAAK